MKRSVFKIKGLNRKELANTITDKKKDIRIIIEATVKDILDNPGDMEACIEAGVNSSCKAIYVALEKETFRKNGVRIVELPLMH